MRLRRARVRFAVAVGPGARTRARSQKGTASFLAMPCKSISWSAASSSEVTPGVSSDLASNPSCQHTYTHPCPLNGQCDLQHHQASKQPWRHLQAQTPRKKANDRAEIPHSHRTCPRKTQPLRRCLLARRTRCFADSAAAASAAAAYPGGALPFIASRSDVTAACTTGSRA